jgi:hypothetical protein
MPSATGSPSAFDTLIFLLVFHCDINRFRDLWVFPSIFVDVHHQYLANGTMTRVVTVICPELRGRLTQQRENQNKFFHRRLS